MKKVFIVALCVVMLSFVGLLAGCEKPDENPADPSAIRISIINLIADPEDYHGKVVRVIGVGHYEKWEGFFLYLGEADRKHSVDKNGLQVLGGSGSFNKMKRLSGKYVIVEGTFDMNNKGPWGLYSGTIDECTRYELWKW